MAIEHLGYLGVRDLMYDLMAFNGLIAYVIQWILLADIMIYTGIFDMV